MFVNVGLITDSRRGVLLVPKEALTYDAGQPYAFVVRDSTVHRTLLELGLTNPREVEVVAGLAKSDSVVIVGQEGLRDGAKVRVVAEPLRAVPKEAKAERDTTET
jgi:membrane fusion protein (multidrug efflux system)